MDIASLAGIILGAVMFVFGVFSNGGFEALKNMVDSASIIITVGGSISGVLAAHKLPDFINGLKGDYTYLQGKGRRSGRDDQKDH